MMLAHALSHIPHRTLQLGGLAGLTENTVANLFETLPQGVAAGNHSCANQSLMLKGPCRGRQILMISLDRGHHRP